jgi:two-component system LytT family response regulator
MVIDDEPLARSRLRELLDRERDIDVVGEAGSGGEAIAAIGRLRPDLVFLDVQMPERNGFEVLAALEHAPPAVVFVTAYDAYALRAFDVHALDYLLKPFDRHRFARALDRARAVLERRRADGTLDERIAALLAELAPGRRAAPAMLERIAVKRDGRVRLVPVADIDYVEAAGNYLRVYVGNERHVLRETLSAFAAKLDPARFVRIHRSTIVNIDRVRELEPYFHGDYIVRLADGRRLTLSRTYREHLRARLGQDI